MSTKYNADSSFHSGIVRLANGGMGDMLISKRMQTSMATVRVIISLARAARVSVLTSAQREGVRKASAAMVENIAILEASGAKSALPRMVAETVQSSPIAHIRRGMPLTQVAALHRMPYREVTALADKLRATAKPLNLLLN